MADYVAPRPAPGFRLSPALFIALLSVFVLGLIWWHPEYLIPNRRPPAFVISEIQADNWSTLADADGAYVDWIEIHNPGSEPRALTGWYLTDDFKTLTKWQFPELELEAGGFLVVFASGKNRTQFLDDLHTNFSLDAQGEYLALVDPSGKRVVQEYLPKFPPQAGDDSYGIREGFFRPVRNQLPVSYRHTAYYDRPSPGAPNQSEIWGQVSDTRFSQDGGWVQEPFELRLETKTPKAEIWFTTDGSWPTPETGRLYQRPLQIERTTTLRAAAYRPHYKPTNVDTQTYLFADDVLQQDGRRFPSTWGMKGDWEVPADYEMDPEVIGGVTETNQLHKALQALPSVSLVLAPEALFDRAQGIYANPESTGRAWERAASLEWFGLDGDKDFRVNCGVRIQGGVSRSPEESPKHSFRLLFRDRFGAPELSHRLFGKSGGRRFSNLVLRAGSNNSWLHWNAAERARGDLLRDEWVRRSLAALEQPSARGRFVHLYLNGLYWGIYNLCERPDTEFLAAAWKEDSLGIESRNASGVLNGSDEAWQGLFRLANQGLADAAGYEALSERVAMDAFIDYLLVQLYGGSAEWGMGGNWYAGRTTDPPGAFHFMAWDGERVLENVEDNVLDRDGDMAPPRLFQRLRANAAFRTRFASRAAEVLGPGGALSPDRAAQRFRQLAGELESAMILESARWGDYRRDVHSYRVGPYERYEVSHWQTEVTRLLEEYFPARTERFVEQLRQRGLWVD